MIDIYNPSGQKVGIVSNGFFIIHKKPQHFMVKFQGFGISNTILTKLNSLQVKSIRFVYNGAKGEKIFECDIDKFNKSTSNYTFTVDDIKDLQIFVPMKEYTEVKIYEELK